MENDPETSSSSNENAQVSEDCELSDSFEMKEIKPFVGMIFSSSEAAKDFYNGYAKQKGFGTRINKSWCNKKTNEKNLIHFCCSKEGFKVEKKRNYCYRKSNTRVGCKAHFKIKLMDSKQWQVVGFESEHNHLCSPSKARRFRSHKHLELGSKRRLELHCDSGIRLSKSFHSIVNDAGGYPNVPFGKKDARNHVDKYKRLKLKEGDAEAMHTYFTKMQQKDSNFFYLVDIDKGGRLRNVFWADARSRSAYRYFGDVITFDTTYLTNRYDLKFAPFVGVNHHGQSVLLGCGLLADEKATTFVWVFKAWLSAMSGCAPNAIITNQDKAIENAITEVFPRARHRICLWHIMDKISKKLGSLNDYKAVKKVMKQAIYDTLTIEDFVERWKNMIQQYQLQDNVWLTTLYNLRQKWVPVFLKGTFFAGMSTTQRSESINSFFDGYVHARTSLKEFVEQYESALEDKYEKESNADFESFNGNPSLKTTSFFEIQIAKIYTLAMFEKFQDEVHGMGLCSKLESKLDGESILYMIKERVWNKNGDLLPSKTYEVIFNKNQTEAFCICRLFEYKGILCKHVLYVLNEHVDEIPSQYILPRWRKDFKRKYVENSCSSTIDPKNPIQRYDILYPYAAQILEEGKLSESKYRFVLEGLKNLKKLASEHIDSCVGNEDAILNDLPDTTQSNTVKLKNPLQANRGGRPPKSTRILSSTEKSMNAKNKKVKKPSSSTKTSNAEFINFATGGTPQSNKYSEIPAFSNPFETQESTYKAAFVSDESLKISNEQTFTQLLERGSYPNDGQTSENNMQKSLRRTNISAADVEMQNIKEESSFTQRNSNKILSEEIDVDNTIKPKAEKKRKRQRKMKDVMPDIELQESTVDKPCKFSGRLNEIPPKVRDLFKSWGDVKGDGHCGFRAVAEQLDLSVEDGWKEVRKGMLEELRAYAEEYTSSLGGKDFFEEMEIALQCETPTAPTYAWMSLPSMGSIVASAFHCIFVVIESRVCLTYLPLREPPNPSENRIITICYIDNRTHFVKVELMEDSPLPPIAACWRPLRYVTTIPWEDLYKDKFDRWEETVGVPCANKVKTKKNETVTISD